MASTPFTAAPLRYAARPPVSTTFGGLPRLGGAAEDALVPHPHRDPLAVEVLQQRDGVLPGDPEQVLHVGRADLRLRLEELDELALDLSQDLRVEEERLLDPHEAFVLEEELEEFVLLRPREAGLGQRFLRARRRRACLA